MAQPWITIDKLNTPDGVLELRKRGEADFLILINGRVLMNSSANRSEIALGRDACRMIGDRGKPRVLIGGLGMAITLRSALEVLPFCAEVIVAELNPVIAAWCKGPLGSLTGNAVQDPRVSVVLSDVVRVIEDASHGGAEKFDAIIIDLYEGPGSGTDPQNDPFYGSKALERTFSALAGKGVFAVWGENPDAAFEKRLNRAGFLIDRQRPGRGGLRHVVYLARKA